MSIEELRNEELESFVKDFKELISKHEDTLKLLRMGLSFSGSNE